MPAAFCALLVLPALGASAAQAPTRDEYVAQLERICKPETEATRRAMKGTSADVKAERLAVAAAKFAKASAIFAATTKKMTAVPRPPADTAKLKTWFGYLKNQEKYLREITAQLRSGHLIKAQRLLSRFIHNGHLANYAVLPFGFKYCSFEFSRYG
ncbi:MAG TPA: hypothetical protein VMS11_09790 [Solirubrobacterales bacterium]|nr:hypothetical protein [Solirubrobacterales bacterium]